MLMAQANDPPIWYSILILFAVVAVLFSVFATGALLGYFVGCRRAADQRVIAALTEQNAKLLDELEMKNRRDQDSTGIKAARE